MSIKIEELLQKQKDALLKVKVLQELIESSVPGLEKVSVDEALAMIEKNIQKISPKLVFPIFPHFQSTHCPLSFETDSVSSSTTSSSVSRSSPKIRRATEIFRNPFETSAPK